MSTPPVVVAGGGVAGLAAALAIARTGREVEVFERAAGLQEEGAGIQLSPNATRHLRAWGVLDMLSDAALSPDATVVRRGRDGALLAKLDLQNAERQWGAPFRVAHRADLLQALSQAVQAQPRIAVTYDAEVTGWSGASGLDVVTREFARPAAALIVADGVRSVLREQFELGARLNHSGRTAWRALVPADRCPSFARASVTNLWLGPRAHLVHYPLRAGSMVNLVAVMSDAMGSSDKENQTNPLLSRAFQDWSHDARDLVACAEGWRAWPLFSRALPSTLSRGLVAIVGDAAHPMMPFLAQGGAQAIEDAAALGESFLQATDARAALAQYSRTRLSRAKAVVAASEQQATIYHLRGPAAVARDLVMRAAGGAGLRLAADWIWRV